MANPSKRTPWTVEMKPDGLDDWYAMAAYRDEEEAIMQAELMRKRVPPAASIRVVKFEES